MELNCVISILDRTSREKQEKIYHDLGLTAAITMLGRGTASRELLSLLGLTATDKAVMVAVAGRDDTRKLFSQARQKLYIDIPGNGIMLSVPVKSVGGARTLAWLTGGKQMEKGKPAMDFEYELIYVILNEGHSDEVMDAARPAGAAGGTVLSAKGTGIRQTEKFHGLSITSEKEVVLIVARSAVKADIMRAVAEKAGLDTPAGAVCFSLPVTRVEGLRRLEEEAEEEEKQQNEAAEDQNKTDDSVQ